MLAERARFDALERTPTIKSNHANIAYRSEFLVLTNTSPKREVRLICGCRHSLFGSAILSSIIDIFAGYMKPQAAAAAADNQVDADSSASPSSTTMTSPQSLMSPSSWSESPSSFMDSPIPALPTVPSIPIPPSRYPIAADTYHSHYSGSLSRRTLVPTPTHLIPRTNPRGILLSPMRSVPILYIIGPISSTRVMPVQPPAQIPPLSFYYRPHRLEEIAPRDTISLIIALFFDFVYPLTPCVHKPSFMADLHAHREERDPLFFALVMSTVASTLVQVPRSYLPMDRPVVRNSPRYVHYCRSWLLSN